ncbi:DUF4394 domain-containing protein [Waterburya agarophytonicola]|nr:DUF4394 domain-containing protein [Waterburya agarophytonicola]
MEFTVDLSALNSNEPFGSDASGEVTLTLDAPSEDIRTLRVQIDAEGLEDVSGFGGIHVAHIHGQFLGNAANPLLEQGDGSFFDGTGGESVNSILPTIENSDIDGDGFVNFLEGRPNYGPVILNLTSEQIESAPEGTPPLSYFLQLAGAGEINPAELFPSGTEFNLDTTYTFDLTDPDQLRQYNNLTPLNEREVVIHGLTIPVEISEAIDETAMGTAPAGIDLGDGEAFRITAPVAAGTIEVSASTDVSQLVALNDDNTLVSFDSNNPGVSQFTDITGVEGVLLGIDTRPADGSIYGISTANNIYTIDPSSGEATYISTLDTPFEGGTISGFDFNPVADRLRLVGDNDQDFRINVDTGEVTVDGTLAFADGDANDGINPNVTAAAYTNSFDGTVSTELYDIDTLLNNLVLQNPPNDGTLETIGDLGIDFDTLGGFEIVSAVEGDNTAFAVSNTTLYSIDLETGTAKSLGEVGSINPLNLQGLTAIPEENTPTINELLDNSEIVALTDNNTLVSFDQSNPSEVNSIEVTGIDGFLLGIDTRPADGLIYSISTANNIYTIDPSNGEATYVSTLDTPFEGGTISGFDFNPAADRLRLVGDNDQDFRINVDTGEVTVDGTLAFAEGDINQDVNPNVTAAAYTNSFDGTETTQLYDIDTLLNDLVLQNPPNDGTLETIGDLGIDFDTLGGFDILSSVDGDNVAFAASNSSLYTINLGTGEAINLGEIDDSSFDNLQGLTIVSDFI